MATWTDITNAALEPDKPIRSVDGLALRDNPIAIAEGAAGAPKVRTEALQPPASGQDFLIFNLQESEVETSVISYPDVSLNNRADSAQHLGVNALVAGTITCYAEHKTNTNGSVMRVLKNGAIVTSWSTTSTSFVVRVVDVSVGVGDVVIFQSSAVTSGGISSSVWRNLRIYSSNPDMAVA